LLTAILKTLRDLHAEYRGIRVHEIVPCSCEACRSEKNPQHYFEFENLRNRLEKGRRVVECDKSLEEVDLLKILGDLLVFERLEVGGPVVLGKSEKSEVLTKEVIAGLREQLAIGELDEVMGFLKTHKPTEITLLRARVHEASKNTILGLDKAESEAIIKQQTTKGILDLLEGFEQELG
jgi:hypothetical protein